ncbi:Ig-like domain-containing protein [Chryseobacterium sp. MEBOG06]|uniref:Ig-like domain-containing protein n=1 Tax=unclassified Chryseobacterium TaxID=2593645 RepID=UPI001F3A5F21|nr:MULTISPECIES: Ig-like domain-containing protein [unclassified Chryseobacterium]UKB83681.1 Ig-like domain-containing protein [Chryseobacterium sp. MEBOG06]
MKRFLLLFVICFLVHSCARVGSPVGGPRDTLAPKFLSSNIDTTRINVKRDIHELRLDFDEYITLKDISKNLIISPPIKNIKRILPSNIANRFVLIQWTDTLQANTTYNFNFGNSIVDNNEANILRYFNFAFSTGDKLDDLYVSGEVKDAMEIKKKTGNNENKLVVGLYQLKDTMNYKQKPYYITKVDDDGYYELNYLSPGKYKIIAFDDENGNSIYDAGKEKIGFQKEPLDIDKSISGLNLKVYPSKKPVKYSEMKEVSGGVLMMFEGHPEDVKVQSLNEKLKDVKITHTPKSDSVRIWFDAVKSDVGQTVNEKLLFSHDKGPKKDSAYTVSLFYKYNKKNAMDIFSDNDGSTLAPKADFKILSNYIVDKIDPSKWTLNIKGDSLTTLPFNAKISATNPYQILIQSDFISGKDYQLTVPKETVSSFYAKNVQSKRFDFGIGKVEQYGSLEFTLTNAPAFNYWIQLLDSSDKVVHQKYTKGDKVKFDLLKPEEYFVRILVDNNGNKYWDEADFTNQVFAEDAYIFYKKALVRALWETREDWDLNDKRTLENPKGTVSPVVPAVPAADSKEVGTVKQQAKKEIKSTNAILTPVK